MLKFVIKIFIFLTLFVETAKALDAWLLPDPKLRYDQTSFLTAHNAFANFNQGWQQYMMQTWSIEEQLDHGVRGLMLDTHETEGTVRLCHVGCSALHTIQKGIGPALHALWERHEYELLTKTLGTIKDWLDRHPSEVVTLFLENRVDNDKLAKEIESVPGLMPMILKLTDWDPHEYGGMWPTIAWLRAHNKRVIIFNEDKTGSNLGNEDNPERLKYPFSYTWHYLIESQYGSVNKDTVCAERATSKKHEELNRLLYLVNFFRQLAGSPTASKQDNDYNTLKEVINLCRQRDIAGGKYPNFLALDFVEEGNGMQLINEFNTSMRFALLFMASQCPIGKTCPVNPVGGII